MNENNNITLEQVEKLRAHANVSYEDARAALEATGGDMLEAIIRLEKEGKTRSHTASHSTLNPVPMQSNSSGWQYGQGHQGPSEFSRQMASAVWSEKAMKTTSRSGATAAAPSTSL